MIQINKETHTKGGLIIPAGSLLDVTPHFLKPRIVDGLAKYDISFDVTIYKDMVEYLAGKVLTNDYVVEYNIGYQVNDVDIQALTSVSHLLALLQTAIENGSEGYPGVGEDETVIVFPPTVQE